MPTRSRLPLLLLTLSLVAGACGSGDDDQLETRVDSIEERLSGIEDALGIEPGGEDPDPGGATTTTTTEPEADEGPALTTDSRIDLRGVGPVEGGMTVPEAEAASGRSFTFHDFEAFGGHCWFGSIEGLPGLDFLLVSPADGQPVDDPRQGVIGRASVYGHPEDAAAHTAALEWQTVSGIKVGDTEQKVFDTYGADRIEVEPHTYVEGGHYLTYVPEDPADAGFRLRFFTDGEVVTEIHAGTERESGYIEGCA